MLNCETSLVHLQYELIYMIKGWTLTLFCVHPSIYSLGKPQRGKRSRSFDARQTWVQVLILPLLTLWTSTTLCLSVLIRWSEIIPTSQGLCMCVSVYAWNNFMPGRKQVSSKCWVLIALNSFNKCLLLLFFKHLYWSIIALQ